MSDYYVGEIRAFGFDYAPEGWLPCFGQELAVNDYQALFAIIGFKYGGNGSTTFCAPNLSGRTLVGLAPQQTGYNQVGLTGGQEQISLTVSEMPAHTHTIPAFTRSSSAQTAQGVDTPGPTVYLTNAFSIGANKGIVAYSDTPGASQLATTAITMAGGGQPHNNMSPYMAMRICICANGIFPPNNQ